ncbi:unnamed protein product [Closterium sp. NIES-64]|nr:unnamed protein product [Closterium sp. NIES-65]CAI6006898.1 unnamed protein product [Closterium sp. NIES-64]
MSDGLLGFAHLINRPSESGWQSDSSTPKESKVFTTCTTVLGPLLEGYPPDSSAKHEDAAKHSFSLKKLFGAKSGKSKEEEAKARDAEIKFVLQAAATPLASVPKQISLPRPTTPELTQNQRTTRDVLKKYIAASGGYNSHMAQQGSVISGHVTIWASEVVMGDKTVYAAPTAGARGGADVAKGTFRVVQMPPNMWHVAVAMGDTRIDATCDGELVWRRSSWGPSTTAKGPVRPLRHLLAGLDPPTVADVFASGEYQGDEGIEGDECMCVKVMANPLALMSMSTGGGNVGGKQQDVCDVLAYQVEGFFSKASGLLIGLRDHHLTKTKTASNSTIYWERVMVTRVGDFQPMEGGMIIPHSGRSVLSLAKRCDDDTSGTIRAWVREEWGVDSVTQDAMAMQGLLARPADLIMTASSASLHRG